ncbi:hypothetical protein JOE27_002163 [Pseudomonas sp. M5]|nr:hypothetical protein [Pseudomonas sp. M5]
MLSLVTACIALPVLLRGVEKGPDDALQHEVQDVRKRTAEAAIHALEAEEMVEAGTAQNAAQAAMAAELKGRLMAEYRDALESYNDSDGAHILAQQMNQLERRLRLTALRAQRLELYNLHRHHLVGDDVVRKVLGELDMSEANLGSQ